MKKRIMALVLAVLLCVGILPTAVFGEINEGVTQTDIKQRSKDTDSQNTKETER